MAEFNIKILFRTTSIATLMFCFGVNVNGQENVEAPIVEGTTTEEKLAPPVTKKVKKTIKTQKTEIEAVRPERAPLTIAADPGYGKNSVRRYDYFRAESNDAPVDSRDAIDAMADHAILLPTAFTPKKLSTSFTTTNILLNTFSFSPTNDFQISASTLLPTGFTDFLFNGSVKFRIKTDPNYIISAHPFFSYQSGQDELDIANLGLGAGLLADFYISDRLIISTGSFLFLNTLNILDQQNHDACQSHSDFVQGDCINTDTQKSLPSGGHWLSLQASLIYYLHDSFSLRFEAITGLTYGSFLGTEYLDGRDSFSTKVDYFENPALGFGVPKNSIITLGAGTSWSKKNFGIKAAAYLWRGEVETTTLTIADTETIQEKSYSWVLTPTISLTLRF